MANFTVPRLVIRPIAGGFGYYWQPSSTLAKLGWKPIALGTSRKRDDAALLDAARRENDKVDGWRDGGSAPRTVKTITRKETMAALLASYRAELEARAAQWHLPAERRNPTIGEPISPNTWASYKSCLNAVEDWATLPKRPGGKGNVPIAAIDRKQVLLLRDALMTADDSGIVPHHRAHNILRVTRTMFAHGVEKKLLIDNPAENFGLGNPPPRHGVWDEDGGRADIDAFARGAAAIGYPGLALAVELAEYIGQREDDLLNLTDRNWKPITLHDPVLVDALRGDDAELMGIRLQQKKTRRWVGIPIVGPLRRKIEAVIAAGRARNPDSVAPIHILIDDVTGEPWTVRQFQRKFLEAKQWAIDHLDHAPLAGLQYRDLRRTCVVRCLEKNLEPGLVASITGHSLKTIEAMMEIYGPRTTRQAAIAILAIHGRTERTPAADSERKEDKGAVEYGRGIR